MSMISIVGVYHAGRLGPRGDSSGEEDSALEQNIFLAGMKNTCNNCNSRAAAAGLFSPTVLHYA